MSALNELKEQKAMLPASWCLRLVDGNMAWSNWALSETPLLVGRGLGCRLRLDDSRVSRTQCEVRLVDGVPHLRNHSEVSPTRLNGSPCDTAQLRLGDLIEFADFRLIVDCLAPPSDLVQPAPTTRAFLDTPFNLDLADASITATHPTFTGDLLSLFHFSRKLAQADSMDTLVHEVRAHLAQRLRPDSRWVAWRVRTDGEITLYPAPSLEESATVPLAAIRQACAESRGVVGNDAQGAFVAAPLVCAGETYGAICVHRLAPRTFQEKHLHYLLAVAECAAPLIRAMEHIEQLKRDEAALGARPATESHLAGSGRVMQDVRTEIRRVAPSGASVLIYGETGVGKELAARMIHEMSGRASGPYVTVNCAAIPSDLFESEMFGHMRGAFTGAANQRKGLFEQAHGGTLFLDEIGELTQSNQARLLRAVETGTFRRVGGERDIQVDVRIVCATNRPLPGDPRSPMRLDLYHRLSGCVLHIPPLRLRKEDIPELAQRFLLAITTQTPAHPRAFSPDALKQLMSYDWPGNVRELRNVVERACYAATDSVVNTVPTQCGMPAPVAAGGGFLSLEEVERRHLVAVLEACQGNVALAAQSMNMAKSTFYYRLSKHDIRPKELI